MVEMESNALRWLQREIFGESGFGETLLKIATQLSGAFRVQIQVAAALVVPEHHIEGRSLRLRSIFPWSSNSGDGESQKVEFSHAFPNQGAFFFCR